MTGPQGARQGPGGAGEGAAGPQGEDRGGVGERWQVPRVRARAREGAAAPGGAFSARGGAQEPQNLPRCALRRSCVCLIKAPLKFPRTRPF